MKVLIIPDSFKGSLTAIEVASEMEKAVRSIFPEASCTCMPFSDGGEGAIPVLEKHSLGKSINCPSTDGLRRPITAPYFFLNNSQSAWIELSQAAGLVQLKNKERNPLKTSTWGTGLMIRHALDQGCKTIYLGIGGSATHDLGTGIIGALGGKFYDKNNNALEPIGESLSKIERIDLDELDARINHVKWVIACDVQNLLTGTFGAARTYAKQKGATPKIIETLETGSLHFAKVIKKQFGKNILELKGGGAAGGVSAGLAGIFNASIENGLELLAKQTDLEERIKKMDLILTGEGHFDEQSTFGKLPIQVAQLSHHHKIKTLLFAGKTSISKLSAFPYLKIHQTTPESIELEEAMKYAAKNMQSKLLEVLQTVKKQIH